MELKNLLTKFKPKEETPEYFFALEISEDSVIGAVWTVTNGHTQIVKIGPNQSWDGKDQNQLLTAVDQSISQASENLQPEPNGIIFGLPESWLETDDINTQKKSLLKFVCQELTLKPLGFVATSNAVVQSLKIEEGTPPSAIFIELHPGELNLTLVKLGKIIGTEIVGRSDDLGKDVEEGLSRFTNLDTLPARMLLYDNETDFEEAKQQLTSYEWEEKLPFIHFPKVDILPSDSSIKAIALAGGSEVAQSLGFEIKTETPKVVPPVSASAESLGFVVNEDIADASPIETAVSPELTPSSPKTPFWLIIKTKALNLLTRLPKVNRPHNLFLFVGLGFLALFLAIFSAYWYLPKAKVTILVEPKIITTDLNLAINPQAASTDTQQGVLPGKSVSISVTGEKSIATTGTNIVGEKAKGDISIYNKTAQSKTFPAATVLIGPDNLAFSLDEETTVASRSAVEDSDGVITITPGKADARITAKSIGPESNLAANTKMIFKQFAEDDYYAKTSGLGGGTAREVRAVSKADQDSLLEDLTSELKAKAENSLQTQIGAGWSLVDIEQKDQAMTKTFNFNVGEETDNLKLSAKLEYQALSYIQSDLDNLLIATIKEKIPENFILSDSLEINKQPAILQKDGTALVEINFKAQLLPKMDFNEIKQNLKGRYPAITQSYLASLPSFLSAEISITPNLPQKLKTFPHVTKNIVIEVKTGN